LGQTGRKAYTMSKIVIPLGILLVLVFFSPILRGEVKTPDHPQGQNIIKLNNIIVDKIKKEIRINAKLAITEGILEYLLVGNQGKTYESIFKVIDNKPSELNFALLLIGCKNLDFNEFLKLKDEGNGIAKLLKHHKKSLLEINILKDGRQYKLQRLMIDREKSASPFIWVYTGGVFIKDHGYAGDLEFSYVGIWPDRVAVINLFNSLKNPYRGDFGYEINKAVKEELAVDQAFEIIIRRRLL
jgi:hypothetical protein